MLGSAVRLPYHQPEKKDLSVFLARTELKQQKFVGSSRLSWKQFVPPGSSLVLPTSCVTQIDSSLSTDAVPSEKPTLVLISESSTAFAAGTVVDEQAQECNELPDFNFSSSKSEIVSSDVPLTCTEVSDTEGQLSPRSVPRKLLLLSPVKSISVTSDPLRNDEQKDLENSQEQVDTLLAPAIGKKLLLDPIDKNESSPSASNVMVTVASETVESAPAESGMSNRMVVDLRDEDDAVAKILQQSTSRAFRRALPSNIPLPQLSGNPNDFIELDDECDDDGEHQQMNACDQGVEQLMERLIQHARGPTQSRKPKTVEIR